MKRIYIALGILPLFIACNNENANDDPQFDFGNSENNVSSSEEAEEMNTEGEENTIQLTVGEDGQIEMPEGQGNISVEAAPQASASNASGDVKINPPHGEPGHRCDIPVGQPLDGSGTPAPNINASPQPVAPSPSPANIGSGKANPPHGEPGHRCDIPVGQPLP